MIEVKNLTKSFKRGKIKTTALNNVSFNLGNKGFVFILGKSGSGKSTLLNILGGLNSATSGEIIADGNNIVKFNKAQYDKYRNSYIGYIFQEFYLIEQLTLEQNVALSLDLANKKDKEAVQSAIDKVRLKGLEQRYIYELSGGQRQRVAIARALVKNPNIILADEPTGNLDSKNATQILKLLKKISKEKLVVIVSHNIESAYEYADRIIELADGEIIRDEERVPNYVNDFKIMDETLTLPYCKEIGHDDLITINANLQAGNIKKIEQLGSGFVPSENKVEEYTKVKLKKANMNIWKSLSLAAKFFKKTKFSTAFTLALSVLIIFILGICQFFIQYDASKSISDVMIESNETDFVLYQGRYYNSDQLYVTIDTPVRADASDAIEFKNAGYDGNIYPLYNFSLPISTSNLPQEKAITAKTNTSSFYAKETYGTLVTDEQYLIRLFGQDGKLNVLAGNLTDKPYGVIITDYIADSIIYNFPTKYTNYEELLGNYMPSSGLRGYINAVIDTGYKEKYSEEYIAQHLREAKEINEGKRVTLSDADTATELANYTKKYIGLSYSLNKDFGSTLTDMKVRDYANLNNILITYQDGSSKYSATATVSPGSLLEFDLTGNDVVIGLTLYNTLFGTKYTKTTVPEDLQPQVLKIDKYDRKNDIEDGLPTLQLELNVVGINTGTVGASSIVCSDEIFTAVRDNQTFIYGYYFDNIADIGDVYEISKTHLYSNSSSLYKAIGSVSDIVKIFESFILLITLVLCFTCVLLLIRFGFGNIRKNKYEIGVLLALGGNHRTIIKIFLSQIVFVGIVICALSTASLIFLTTYANGLIVEAFVTFIKNPALESITILSFNPMVLSIDIIIIILVTIISAIIPTLYLRNIKPINIMKVRD